LDVKALTRNGYGMEKEAIRLIKDGPRWTPAIQNGHTVNAYRKQPIIFVVEEEPGNTNSTTAKKEMDKDAKIPEISVKDLRNASVYKLLQLEEGIEIIGYDFSIDTPNDSLVVIPNTGNQFSIATKMQLNNAKPGRMIILASIKIKKDGQEKKITVRAYKVVA